MIDEDDTRAKPTTTPSGQDLLNLYRANGGSWSGANVAALAAIWRAGCDAWRCSGD